MFYWLSVDIKYTTGHTVTVVSKLDFCEDVLDALEYMYDLIDLAPRRGQKAVYRLYTGADAGNGEMLAQYSMLLKKVAI